MRILYTNFHNGLGGGHTTYVLALMRNPEHTLFCACPGSSNLYMRLHEQGCERLLDMYFPRKITELPSLVKAVRKFKKYIEDNNIDIVHTNGSQDNRLAFITRLFCKKKYKIVFTKHNSYRIKNAVSRGRFNKNSAVIFVARSIYQTIGFSDFKVPVTVIENGIDIMHWQKTTPLCTGEKLHFISNAGTSAHKGWAFLAEAVNTLSPEEQARIRISVLGNMPKAEDIQKAQSLCNIDFPGYHDDTRPFLEDADIGFVLSYGVETISFACREMMSMSLPVMVSDYASLPDNIEPDCGWVTQTRNIESIANTVRAILAMSPAEITAMKAAARAKAERSFSIEKMLAETNRVYEALK